MLQGAYICMMYTCKYFILLDLKEEQALTREGISFSKRKKYYSYLEIQVSVILL